jgi:hypothetical protein
VQLVFMTCGKASARLRAMGCHSERPRPSAKPHLPPPACPAPTSRSGHTAQRACADGRAASLRRHGVHDMHMIIPPPLPYPRAEKHPALVPPRPPRPQPRGAPRAGFGVGRTWATLPKVSDRRGVAAKDIVFKNGVTCSTLQMRPGKPLFLFDRMRGQFYL